MARKRQRNDGAMYYFELYVESLLRQALPGNLKELEDVAWGLSDYCLNTNKDQTKRLLHRLAKHPGAKVKHLSLKAKAKKGQITAMRNLGTSYARGLFGFTHARLAMYWWKRAVAKGDAMSARLLAEFLGSSRKSSAEQDEDTWMFKAARMGDPAALYQSATQLLRPVLPVERFELAKKFLMRAQARGHRCAREKLKEVLNSQPSKGSENYPIDRRPGLAPVIDAKHYSCGFFEMW